MQTLSSKVSEKFQITLPRQVREAILIKAGDRVVFVKEDSGVTIRRLDDLMDEVLDSFSDLEETEREFKQGFLMDAGEGKNSLPKRKKIVKKTSVKACG